MAYAVTQSALAHDSELGYFLPFFYFLGLGLGLELVDHRHKCKMQNYKTARR